MITYRIYVGITLLTIFLTSSACGGSYPRALAPSELVKTPLSVEVASSFRPLKLNEVGVLPVENASLLKSMTSEDSKILTNELYKAFSSNSSLELKLLDPAELNATLKERALKAGASQNVQGVLVGLISGGEPLSSHKDEYHPVQFEIRLFDRSKKEIVWSAFYVSGNQPLSDNLLRFREKAKRNFQYRSSADALRQGFQAAAHELEKLRLASSKTNRNSN